jgi:hypothetical protein
VGASLGITVGDGVGANDVGVTVGDSEGVAVGMSVGEALGTRLGLVDGFGVCASAVVAANKATNTAIAKWITRMAPMCRGACPCRTITMTRGP